MPLNTKDGDRSLDDSLGRFQSAARVRDEDYDQGHSSGLWPAVVGDAFNN